jgi:hypothetical protein
MATLGSSSWMPCAPQGIKGLDDFDDESPFVVLDPSSTVLDYFTHKIGLPSCLTLQTCDDTIPASSHIL